MRPIMRILMLGAVVFVGLLFSGSRPDTPIQPTIPIGFYLGTYDFVLTSKTHVFKEGADGDTVLSDEHIGWIGDGTIDLRTPGYVQATAGLLKNNVDITQAGDITGTAKTGNCSWSETLLARGKFGNSWTIFNWSAQSWDTSLLWNKITDFTIVSASGSGSVQACHSFGVKTANEQKEAVEAVTRSIKKIRFTITPSSLFDMKGNCSLPNWVGKIAIPDGWSERSNNRCVWELFPVESQQWKNPSKIGK